MPNEISKIVTVGTDPGCNICITSDPYVSPIHAVMAQLDNGDVYIADYGSTNGTQVERNGSEFKVTYPRQIFPGDTVIVGRTRIPWSTGATVGPEGSGKSKMDGS